MSQSKPLRGTELKRFNREVRRAVPLVHSITVILQSVEYPVNVGSAFRIADATGVEALILTGVTPTPDNATVAKVGRGKHERVPWRYEADSADVIARLKADGYRIYAIELTADAQPYPGIEWPQKVALVMGHEDHGVTRATLAQCDQAVYVPMWGKGASLNVHVALAVVLYGIRCG